MTGKCAREKRMKNWNSKRVFFATPQTIQNDIVDPSFPASAVKLIVVDEAHKAKGKFAYCEVIREIHARNPKFRVLALSATPGKQDDVIEIIRNLLISKIEVRTENSIDVQPYTFSKQIKVIKVPFGPELASIQNRFINIVDPYLRKLLEFKVITSSHFSKNWMIMQHRNFNQQSHPQRTEINHLFSIAVSLLYSLDLLERHGIQNFLKTFEDDTNVTKMKYFVTQDRDLKDLLVELNEKYKDSNPLALNVHALPNGQIPSIVNKNLIYGHPKFDILKTKLTEYFNNGGTKSIVFCEFRDTATLVYTLLLQLRPVILPKMLIGQGGAVSQKDQMAVMKDFRTDKVNVLVTTSVCEEGIDVGEVDLVICFDINSKNPTRFVQRIGRTGRKRKGKVIILAAEGREYQVVGDVIGSKEKLNKSIHGNKEILKNLYKNSPRLVPMNFMPKCVETRFNIPEVETEVKPMTRQRKIALRKTHKPVTSITSHFKPTQKPVEEEERVKNIVELIEVQDVAIANVEKEKVPGLSTHKKPDEILNEFNEKLEKILNKVAQNEPLSVHLKLSSEKDLKTIDNMMKILQNTTAEESFEFDSKFATFLEDPSIFDDSCEAKFVTDEEPKPVINKQTPKVEQDIFESQDDQFVESRYANQFSFGGAFQTPIKSSFQAINTIMNSTIKPTPLLAASSGHKKSVSAKKKPIKDSPLIKAFEKQKALSFSTPITTRNESFQQSLVTNLTDLQTPTSVKSNKTDESINIFKFFGISSIDEVFDDLSTDSEDEEDITKNKSETKKPATCENSIAQQLDDDIDDEIVESSFVEEAVSSKSQKRKKENNQEENIEFDIDEIFSNSDESSAELEKNIQDIPSDTSNLTQEYNFKNIFEKEQHFEKENTPPAKVSPPERGIVLIVSPVTITVDSPKKSPSTRPRPNISKLMNALKSTNIFSPTTSKAVTNQSPASSMSNSSPILKTPLHSVSTPKLTKILTPSHFMSPISSRSNKLPPTLKPTRFNDSVATVSETDASPLPICRKNKRKRPRNIFNIQQFLDTQAAVDGSDSSDEDDDECDSFIDNDNSIDLSTVEGTQVDMQLKYIQSLNSPSARQNGNFKIPTLAPQSNIDVFSQVPQDDDSWELDSFVVEGVQDEPLEDEPDELEIAEMILKQKRKQQRQTNKPSKRRKIVRMHESSDEEELQELRKQLKSNPD